MTDSTIHLRVPAETKARWVRESRAAGMRLTDWIVRRVEMAVFDVTLYWHTGGSVFLGTVLARNPEDAADSALQQYRQQSDGHAKEIDDGGNYQLEAALLTEAEESRWHRLDTPSKR